MNKKNILIWFYVLVLLYFVYTEGFSFGSSGMALYGDLYYLGFSTLLFLAFAIIPGSVIFVAIGHLLDKKYKKEIISCILLKKYWYIILILCLVLFYFGYQEGKYFLEKAFIESI